MTRIVWLLAALALLPVAARAQTPEHVVVGTESITGCSGTIVPCWTPSAAAGGGGTVTAPGTNGTNAQAVQGINGGVPVATATTPGTRTEVPLDVAAVTTANTAVTALNAGHRTAGGWIENPPTATTVICVNSIGTATFTGGACVGSNNGISPGQTYVIPANANAVSVIASDAAHGFSGEGLQ